MKLYVWEDVLEDYTPGAMIALANSVEEARDLLREDCYNSPDLQQEPDVYENVPFSLVIYGGG